ncbi:beta strand repeat-containing protein, partial [Haemophilus influenzae]|uniref:beta strand repeat-containing protein n=1 Tax=Haemophilus influenzae TaxID=727 RepID=UPI004045EF52
AKDKAMAQIVNNGLISVSKNGSVNLIGGSVKNNGVIKVEDGNILLLAGQKVTISDITNPTITYSVVAPKNEAVNLGTIFAKNGKIQIHAGSVVNKGTLNANSVSKDKSGAIILSAKEGEANIDGTVTLNNANFKAGSLTITGKKVVLNSGAKVELTGKQGGTVYIGGDERGQGKIQLAEKTEIKQGASVNVSGSEKGGKAIVWGDLAQVDGKITAKGKDKKNSGFVETSGKYLGVGKTAKVEAKEWLLDPYNVRIVAQNSTQSENNISASPAITVTGEDAVIFNSTITTALNKGTDVNITTTDSINRNNGSQQGDLTVEADIIKTSGDDATLTLTANNKFTQQKNTKIKSEHGKLNVTINSGNGLELKGEIDTKEGDLNIKTTTDQAFIENAILRGKGIVQINGKNNGSDTFNNKNNNLNGNNFTHNRFTIKNATFEGYGTEGLKLQYNSPAKDWYRGKYDVIGNWEGSITTRGKVVFERRVTDRNSQNVSISTHNWRANLKVENGSFEFLERESKSGYSNAYDKYKDYKLVNIDQNVIFETAENSTVTFNLKPYLGNVHGNNNTPRGLSVSADITAKGKGHVTFDASANGYSVAGIYFDKRSDGKSTTIKTEGTTTLEFKGRSHSRDGLAIKNPLVLDAQAGSHIILNGSRGDGSRAVDVSADVTIQGEGETSIKSTSGNVEVNAKIHSDSRPVNIISAKDIKIKENVEVTGKSVNLDAAEHLNLENKATVTATMGDAVLSGKNITLSGNVTALASKVNVTATDTFTQDVRSEVMGKTGVTVSSKDATIGGIKSEAGNIEIGATNNVLVKGPLNTDNFSENTISVMAGKDLSIEYSGKLDGHSIVLKAGENLKVGDKVQAAAIKNLDVTGKNITNAGNLISVTGNVGVTATETFINTEMAQLKGQAGVTVNAKDANVAGQVTAETGTASVIAENTASITGNVSGQNVELEGKNSLTIAENAQVTATADDVSLKGTTITNSGTVTATQGTVNVAATENFTNTVTGNLTGKTDVAVNAKNAANEGEIHAEKGNIKVTTEETFVNAESGILEAKQKVEVEAKDATIAGEISGGSVALLVKNALDIVKDAFVIAKETDVSLSGENITNSGTVLAGNGGVTVNAREKFENLPDGNLVAKNAVTVNAKDADIAGGVQSKEGALSVMATQDLTVKDNANVLAKEKVSLTAGNDLTTGVGSTVKSENGDVALAGNNITNSGTVTAENGGVEVTATEKFINTETGNLTGKGNVTVNAKDADIAGGVQSKEGALSVMATQDLTVKDNANVLAKEKVSLTAGNDLTTGVGSTVKSENGDVALAGNNITNSGTVTAENGGVEVTATEKFTNTETGNLTGKNNVTVTAENAEVAGTVMAETGAANITAT